ncbi:MAG: hypothetical protein JSS14_18850 [Proteobacteria bacterium]|nr:hypothetical protein [Pseudomonadota bacterium]
MSHVLTSQHPSSHPPPARLNSAQLRELSQQWRQRVDEDPEKVQRVANVLEWLAAQREAPTPSSARTTTQQRTFWQGLASWRIRLSRLAHLHLAR